MVKGRLGLEGSRGERRQFDRSKGSQLSGLSQISRNHNDGGSLTDILLALAHVGGDGAESLTCNMAR